MQNDTTTKQQAATTNAKDIYQQVTDTIVRQLEAGTIPWHRPWNGSSDKLLSLPFNFTTSKSYRGVNILLLWGTAIEKQYNSPEWASFNQWKERKELIRKGEKGTMIVYYDTFEKEVDGEIRKIPFLKSSIVFNRCQLQSFEQPVEKGWEHEPLLVQKIDPIDEFFENTRACLDHIGSDACYIPADDTIYMPDMHKFKDTATCTATEGYYSTLLHELTHWTGAEKRLNRIGNKKFGKYGDENYATEELVAELGAAFLCADFGISTLDKGDHAAYIGHWLKVLKNNKYCLVDAASAASKAVDYLKGLQP